jgi:hypothetical protein
MRHIGTARKHNGVMITKINNRRMETVFSVKHQPVRIVPYTLQPARCSHKAAPRPIPMTTSHPTIMRPAQRSRRPESDWGRRNTQCLAKERF